MSPIYCLKTVSDIFITIVAPKCAPNIGNHNDFLKDIDKDNKLPVLASRLHKSTNYVYKVHFDFSSLDLK